MDGFEENETSMFGEVISDIKGDIADEAENLQEEMEEYDHSDEILREDVINELKDYKDYLTGLMEETEEEPYTLHLDGIGSYSTEEKLAQSDEGYANMADVYSSGTERISDSYYEICENDSLSNSERISELKDLKAGAEAFRDEMNEDYNEWYEERINLEGGSIDG